MGRTVKLPGEGQEWMTAEIRALLSAIRGRHAAKKRMTVIRLAFAKANQVPMKKVLGQEETCSWAVWHQRWKFDPVVKAAYEACVKRALAWADDKTAGMEAHFRRERRQKVAMHSADAPDALAAIMVDEDMGGGHRIAAADRLIQLADPEMAGKIPPLGQPAGGLTQTFNLLGKMSEQEIDQLLGNLDTAEGAAGGVAVGEAETEGARR